MELEGEFSPSEGELMQPKTNGPSLGPLGPSPSNGWPNGLVQP